MNDVKAVFDDQDDIDKINLIIDKVKFYLNKSNNFIISNLKSMKLSFGLFLLLLSCCSKKEFSIIGNYESRSTNPVEYFFNKKLYLDGLSL